MDNQIINIKPKLKVDVNSNPTKKGIKVQFILPKEVNEDEKTNLSQKIQSKLNKELAKYDLTVNIDTDVPYNNVIGFLIRIEDIKLIIKKAFVPKEKKINSPTSNSQFSPKNIPPKSGGQPNINEKTKS